MLTAQKLAFADYYIECGNATEAAKKAGYSDKTARSQGSRLLTDVDVSEYISRRMDELKAKRVASADEVMEFYTRVMRGEEKDAFGLDASLDTRISAGDKIMKRYNAASDKNRSSEEKLDRLLEEFRNAVKPEAD